MSPTNPDASPASPASPTALTHSTASPAHGEDDAEDGDDYDQYGDDVIAAWGGPEPLSPSGVGRRRLRIVRRPPSSASSSTWDPIFAEFWRDWNSESATTNRMKNEVVEPESSHVLSEPV